MKGSTLHRSGLTREKMNLLAALSQGENKQVTRAQLNQYYKTAKAKELDLLWGGVHKGIQKVRSATKGVSSHKSPLTYLLAGFIAGVMFMSIITIIVSVCSSIPNKTVKVIEQKPSTSVAVIGEEGYTQTASEAPQMEEYFVKQGDTLNGIAIKFYGRYDEAKIKEIQRVNNITNPAALKIKQRLVIPVSQDR